MVGPLVTWLHKTPKTPSDWSQLHSIQIPGSDHFWGVEKTAMGFLEPQGQPLINGCFNWMIPNLYIGNGGFTKHLFINGCLGFQVVYLSMLPKKCDSPRGLVRKKQISLERKTILSCRKCLQKLRFVKSNMNFSFLNEPRE